MNKSSVRASAHVVMSRLVLFLLAVVSMAWCESAGATMYNNQGAALSGCRVAGYAASSADTVRNPTGNTRCVLTNPSLDGNSYGEYSCAYEVIFNQGATWTTCGTTGQPTSHQWSSACPAGTTWDGVGGYCSGPLDQFKNLGLCKSCRLSFGDPINGGTGNKYETKVEFVGQGESPLEFAWTYNSLGAPATTVPYGDIVGGLRATTFSRMVSISPGGSNAFVLRPDGNSIAFVKNGPVWVASPGERGTLVQTATPVEEWIYTDLSNNKDYFDSNGRLTSISNAAGRRISLSYGVSGRIESATDDTGRSLVFLYDGNGRLQMLGLPDGGSIGFAYNASSYLEAVTYPGGGTISYSYDESAWDAGTVSGSLTGVTDEGGVRYSSTSYDISSTSTGTQLGGGVEIEQGIFTPSATSGAMSKVVITTANRGTREVSVGVRKGKVLALLSKYSCSGCKTRTETYTYDANGFEDVVIRDGIATDYNYSAAGLLIQKVEAIYDTAGKKRTIQTDWHATFNVPIERRIYDAANTLVGKQTYTYNARGQVLTHTVVEP